MLIGKARVNRGNLIAFLLLSLLLPTIGSTTRHPARQDHHSQTEERADLRELRAQGNAALAAGQYSRAIQIYSTGYEKAKRSGNLRSVVRFLNNLGGAYYQVFRHRDAIRVYLEARDLAASQSDKETLGALDFNLSSLYFDMGELGSALESADQGLKLPSEATARFRAKLLIQCARIKGRQKDWEQANALLQDAIDASRTRPDTATEAQAWNELGNNLLERRQLNSAERALLQAYWLRKLSHDDHLYYSYQSLGDLRMLQGDPEQAVLLFNRAIAAAPAANPSGLWSIYYDRGKARLAQGRLQDAFADFRQALRTARRWRAEVLPADAFRIGAEVELHELYSSYIELGGRLYTQTGLQQFAEEAFAAAEENRAASLRALWAGPDLTQRLPNEYWETLAHLFQSEATLIKASSDPDPAEVRRLRLKVAEFEMHAGLDLTPNGGHDDGAPGDLLKRTQAALSPAELFMGFHVSPSESLVWIVTHRHFELHLLPPEPNLPAQVARFASAVRADSPAAVTLGRELYSELFGLVSRRLLDKSQWIIVPDGPLFELPFAALVEAFKSPTGAPIYLVEHHAIRLVPGISALFRTPAPPWDGPLVAVGDPVYNRADPRISHSSYLRPVARRTPTSPARPFELARLVGSGREIETYGRIWHSQGYQPILLTGEAASRQKLLAVLQQNPSVLHIAAHVLFPPELSSPGFIALALHPPGDVELLSATEIGQLKLNLGLVVLNGCSSARGESLPGAGLMGMTRAWLAAGARGVIVTRWATPDQDQGELFQSFYDRLSSHSQPRPSFSALLQQAQAGELRAGGHRARPSYWAAYFCVETR